ncbi:clathrin light chain-domain-containing protein, partial [Blastocladiella britannica]
SPITGYSANAIPEAESEHIIRWREDFQAAIAARDATEARAKADAIARAKEEIDKFYEGYNTKRDKALAESKVLQEKMLADLNDAQSGTFWERVVKQVEVVGGGSNKIDDSAAKKKAAAAAANANGTAADKDKAGDGSGKSKDVTRFKQVLLALKADKNNAPGA